MIKQMVQNSNDAVAAANGAPLDGSAGLIAVAIIFAIVLIPLMFAAPYWTQERIDSQR